MGWVHNATPAIDAKSQYPTILAVCLCLTIIMFTTVCLRAYVRMIMLKTIGNDDWVIFFSAICSIIYNGLAIGQTKWGLGLDLKDRPSVNLNNYSVVNFTGRPFYMAGITGFKVALCLSYLRILNHSNRIYNRIVWFIMISCVVLHLAGTLVLIFQCSPVRKSWRPRTPGTCLPNDKTFYALSAVTIFYDCTIFLLPIPILLQLQINTRRKAALIGLFLLGLFTTICSVMRMIQIITIAKNGNSTMLVLWGTIEMNVGIALTCFPTLSPLFTYFREKSTIRYGYNSNKGKSSDNASHGHSLNILKSSQQNRERITETSSDRWKDVRDSDDNNSQHAIIGLESSLASYGKTGEGTDKRITATTRVEVITEDVKDGADFQPRKGWGSV